MSRFMARALLIWMAVFALGCAGRSLSQVSAETLIGRWRAVTKGDADEGHATRDARTPTGETVFATSSKRITRSRCRWS
jgi:hypothetical protein